MNIQASFVFRDKNQWKQWKQYLIDVEETQQNEIWNLIDKAIKEAKELAEYLMNLSEYEEARMK